TVEFEYTFGAAGDYTVSVDGTTAGTVTVTDADSDVEYSDLSVSQTALYTGSTLVVSATVENTASAERSYDAPLVVDGGTVETKQGTLDAGASTTVTFYHQVDDDGSLTVSVGDIAPATVTVTAAWTQFGFGDNNVGSSDALVGPVASSAELWNYTAVTQSYHTVRSSPVAVDGVVYAGSSDGTLHAIDATNGGGLWTFDADGPVTNGEAAAVADGLVYATTGGSGVGTVHAIDAATGNEEWSHDVGSPLTSPAVVDGRVYVGSRDGHLYALGAESGTEEWTFDTGREVRTTPAIADGTVYVATYPPQGQSVDERVYAVDATSGHPVWNASEPTLVEAAPAVVDGVVYVGDLTGGVHAYDAANGTHQWSADASGSGIHGAPTVADGVVYVGSDDGRVYALRTGDGSELWSAETNGSVRSSPAVANGIVYAGSYDGHLYALGASTGDRLWRFETGDTVWSSPAVIGGVVFVGSDDGNVYAIVEGNLPAVFATGDAWLSTTEIEAGQSVDATIEVTNLGGGAGTYTAQLEVDGQAIASQSEELQPAETTTFTFTQEFDTPGTFDVSINGEPLGTLTVTEPEDDSGSDGPDPDPSPPEPDPAFFDVTVENTTSPVFAGETVEVAATVENSGEESGFEAVELVVDGAVVDTVGVGLVPGGAKTVTLSWATDADDAGEDVPVRVRSSDDAATATVTVEALDEMAQVVLYGASADRDTVPVGEAVTVGVDLFNAGDVAGSRTVALSVDGQVVDETTTYVRPGLARSGVELTWTPTVGDLPEGEDAMEVTLSVDGLFVETVTVENRYSDVEVVAASVANDELVEDEETYVVGSIYQNGTIEGTETIELTATNQETNETTVVGSQEVTLKPDFYHLGALNVSFRPDDPGTYDLRLGDRDAGTLEVEPAVSDIEVVSASPGDVEVVEDEVTYVVGSIYQNGTVEGTEIIELTATNQETNETTVVGSQEVTLAPGTYHLGALNVSFHLDSPGTYDLRLGDRDAGTLEVEPAVSDIEVVAASVANDELVEDEETYVVGSIYQNGTVEGTETIELTATNQQTGETTVVGSQEATLAPGFYHLGALNVSFQLDDPGTYDLRLGDRHAGTLEVEPAVSDIEVVGASLGDVEVVEGEQTYVGGSVYQNGTIEGTETVELTVTNQQT
ncbi:MAG: PQQ-binding-like beta-propeller repeat protein, partial [Halobacteriota archaeon]